MKLYFYSYYNGKIHRKVKEVKETPKTFREYLGGTYNLYKKSDLGKMTNSYYTPTIFMTEDYFEFAKKAFEKYLIDRINAETEKIQRSNERIREFRDEIEELCELKESEEE